MGKFVPLKYNEVKDRIKSFGYELLTETYRRNNEKLHIVDKEGYHFSTTLCNLTNLHKPKRFNRFNPYTISNIQHYFDLNDIQTKILSQEFIGERKPLKFQCGCGNIFYKDWMSMSCRQLFLCPDCAKKRRIDSRKLNQSDVFSYFEKRGYKIIEEETYQNNLTPITCIDSDGYKVKISYGNLMCGNKNPLVFSMNYNKENYIHNVNHYFEKNNIKCQALQVSEEAHNGVYDIMCKCDCGNSFITNIDAIKVGQTRCRYCSKIMSRLEKKTEDWLKDNNVNYIFQKRFEGCFNPDSGRKLPFDFYLPDLNMCIECDGEQHYYPANFSYREDAKKELELLQKRDEIKNKFCNDNNIILIRIPYFKFRNGTYVNILSDNIL